jgi:hypothetical protein
MRPLDRSRGDRPQCGRRSGPTVRGGEYVVRFELFDNARVPSP